MKARIQIVPAKRPNIGAYGAVAFPLPYSAPVRIPTRAFPSMLGCAGCPARGLGCAGCSRSRQLGQFPDISDLPLPGSPGMPKKGTDIFLTPVLVPGSPKPVTQNYFGPSITPTAGPAWLDQQLIEGVPNKYLVGAGAGIVLLASLRKGGRR